MSLAMDKALMALSLDEEDVPFVMSDLPEFSSAEENKLSLIGRILNPARQKMPLLIKKMPRKWLKEGKVRGIALSQERFQFIFKTEHDLLDVLDRGVHTFEEWVIVLERWVENPPEDFLQYIPLWVQIRNIPVNCYTTEALAALGDLVGKTVLVGFDPTKPVTQDFIRVLVKFNVANPLRTSKVIELKGVPSTVRFSYERVQKRCFTCQRLNHENDLCPLKVGQRQEEAKARREVAMENLEKNKRVLSVDDPLFGVLEENQVIDVQSGQWKIAKDILDEMRRYLRAETGESHGVKVDKIQRSVTLAENGTTSQRLALRMEAPPIFTTDFNKRKGIVFDYNEKGDNSDALSVKSNPKKLMAASFSAYSSDARRTAPPLLLLQDKSESVGDGGSSKPEYLTVFKAANTAPCSSGILRKRPAPRRRPPKYVRQQKTKEIKKGDDRPQGDKREGKEVMGNKKQKCSGEETEDFSNSKAVCLQAVPKEGLPSPQ
ncbi:uncharacterized protein LOC125598285 [Brassica napus]|uniref:uncharacterized protein LOC125598285 n=1 Tax=Brassica napus TaxID=3708 RepID=UPI002078D4F4|nr:uncharacterized protein LOC125598285 [Brassica napus]